jgi:hypothetical protein
MVRIGAGWLGGATRAIRVSQSAGNPLSCCQNPVDSRVMGMMHERVGVMTGVWAAACVSIAMGVGCQPQQVDIVGSFRLADGSEYSYVNRSSGYGFDPNDADEGFNARTRHRQRAYADEADEHQYRAHRPTRDPAPVRYVAFPAAPEVRHVPLAMMTPAPTSVTTVAGNMWSYAGTSPYGSTMVGTGVHPASLGGWGYPMLPGPAQLPNYGTMPVPAGIMPNLHLTQGAPILCPPWPR